MFICRSHLVIIIIVYMIIYTIIIVKFQHSTLWYGHYYNESNAIDSSENNSTNLPSANWNPSVTTQTAMRAWYFRNGTQYPKPATAFSNREVQLFPHQNPYSDRIVHQLMYVPPDYEERKKQRKFKLILAVGRFIDLPSGMNKELCDSIFEQMRCPVNTCKITFDSKLFAKADVVIFQSVPTLSILTSMRPDQISVLYYLEALPGEPIYLKFNWTANYRRDSEIVTPYEKWVYYNPNIYQKEQDRNYALNKQKKVAWFVSHCTTRNHRFQYAKYLQSYIEVDIYGYCGTYSCKKNNISCFELLDRDYKFYLAFENNDCKDYITEKFFINALQHNVLPIVMGASLEDYSAVAPFHSFIHVDEFESPKALATYLHQLDRNNELYNSYFRWKGTGEFINTYFWCRLCALAHYEETEGQVGRHSANNLVC